MGRLMGRSRVGVAAMGPSAGLRLRYGFAIACAVAAVLGRMSLASVWGFRFPYLTFHPAVMLAAWVGGLGPGLLTTGLCALAAVYFWLPPPHSLWIGSPGDRVSLAGFLLVGAIISTLNELLQRRERHARTIIESISDGFVVLDGRGRCQFLNEQVVRLARRRRQDLIGQPIWEIFPEFAGTRVEIEARRALAEVTPRHIQFFSPSLGGWADIHLYPSRGGLAIYFRDINQQKHAEVMSSRLAAIVESSDDAIVSKDLTGTIRSWNSAAERMFGYSSAEAVGQHITMIIPADRRHEEDAVLTRIQSGKSVDHFETVRVRKDGRLIDVSLTVSPIRSADGEVVGASKIARDISARKQVERERAAFFASEQAARAEAEAANRAKDDFLTTLSHELRTPLNAVYGWAAMLQTGKMDDLTTAKAIDAIMRNANIQVQLIDDLLDVSRIASGKLRLELQNVDLTSVVGAAVDAVRPAALAKGIRIDVVPEPSPGPIVGDANRLQQVVWNLLSNAVKFTPRGGRVTVRLRRVHSRLEITVSDTGSGIAPDFLPFVFERFRQGDSSSTRPHGGLGLGLTLVKQLVELHGGTVTAESPGAGRGATFTVRLPVGVTLVPAGSAASGIAGPAARPAARRVPLDGVRVLVVDDDADGLTLVTAMLRRVGASVEVGRSAAQGYALFLAAPPDVLISDIEMPDEDGYGLIRRIRALDPARGGRVPAIALTAYGRREDRVHAVAAGFSMHVPKPVDPAELVTLVASLASR
jgi:PAS domain S-box-containing protein